MFPRTNTQVFLLNLSRLPPRQALASPASCAAAPPLHAAPVQEWEKQLLSLSSPCLTPLSLLLFPFRQGSSPPFPLPFSFCPTTIGVTACHRLGHGRDRQLAAPTLTAPACAPAVRFQPPDPPPSPLLASSASAALASPVTAGRALDRSMSVPPPKPTFLHYKTKPPQTPPLSFSLASVLTPTAPLPPNHRRRLVAARPALAVAVRCRAPEEPVRAWTRDEELRAPPLPPFFPGRALSVPCRLGVATTSPRHRPRRQRCLLFVGELPTIILLLPHDAPRPPPLAIARHALLLCPGGHLSSPANLGAAPSNPTPETDSLNPGDAPPSLNRTLVVSSWFTDVPPPRHRPPLPRAILRLPRSGPHPSPSDPPPPSSLASTPAPSTRRPRTAFAARSRLELTSPPL